MKQNKDPHMTSTIELIYGKKIEDFKKEAKIEGKIEGEQIGLTKGKTQGKIEGKIESQQESARNLLQLGVSAEIISQAVGIPYDEVLAMQLALSPSPDSSSTK
jgi:predicted transposase YdaD